MSATVPVIRIFGMPLQKDQDVVLCRNRARLLAGKCGYPRQDQIRIATAVSEIARNAFQYATGAMAWFSIGASSKPPGGKSRNAQVLCCRIEDKGPGITNLDLILSGQYRSTTGLGMGLSGAYRLMDRVQVETSPSGTTVTLEKELPRGRQMLPSDIPGISDAVMGPIMDSALHQMEQQDKEVQFMFREIGAQGLELAKVNEELTETNKGVVALYDELDTVYRLGHVLGSKLELDHLLQAIIDATTEISGADIGIFLYEEPGLENPSRRHTSGPLAHKLDGHAPIPIGNLFGEGTSLSGEMIRYEDLRVEGSLPFSIAHAAELRSALALPVFSTNGQLVGALIFAHRDPEFFSDRSERILSSVAIQASIGIENARLYKDVQSASAAKDDFLAVLSHELRNPLNPIFARLALLEEDAGMSAQAREHLRMIRSNLELETRLIDDLLDMTRIARGKIVLNRAPADLHTIIHSANHACSTLAGQQSVQVLLQLVADRHVVHGDAVRLQQVFWNLLNNAIKFSPGGSQVIVRTRRTGSCIQITVSDSGRGIDKTMLNKIFLPFEQVDANTTNARGGLGLGLAICRNIVMAHGGTITAESEGGEEGSVFTVTLELSNTPALTPDPVLAPASPPGGRNTYAILLVDDHEDTRCSYKTLLENRGHRVVVAGTVREARQKAEQQKFELLISDIGLPDGTGCDLMRSLADLPDITGIAVSGYGMKEDVLRSREAGFSAHLIKPLKVSHLDAVICKVMARSRNEEGVCDFPAVPD